MSALRDSYIYTICNHTLKCSNRIAVDILYHVCLYDVISSISALAISGSFHIVPIPAERLQESECRDKRTSNTAGNCRGEVVSWEYNVMIIVSRMLR